jgi:hypothetical protein
MSSPSFSRTPIEAPWSALIPDEQWTVFLAGQEAARRMDVPFLLGGAMALATYTGRWRNTKDIDFIVRAEDRERLVEALLQDGFEDYHGQEAYDRSWIFRGFRDGVILDLLWDLPNHRVAVDDVWFQHARPVQVRDQVLHAMPLEELIRVKLYVLQRERCDWVDVLNALAGSVEAVNWDHLIERMGRDLPLLQGVLCVFSWLSPGRAEAVPEPIRRRFALPVVETEDAAAMEQRRVRLFDSRPWFAPLEPEDRMLER